MKTCFNFFSFLIIFLLVSCSTAYKPPIKYNFQKSETISKNYNDAWNRIIQFISSNNIPLKTIDKSSGIVASDFNLSVAQYVFCDCGVPGKDLMYKYAIEEVTGNFNIVVREINQNSTNVTVNTFYKAKYNAYEMRNYRYYFSGTVDIINCNSTGLLENALFEYLE